MKMGSDTEKGSWNNLCHVQFTFNVGSRTFFFGPNLSTTRWFAQKLVPGGMMGCPRLFSIGWQAQLTMLAGTTNPSARWNKLCFSSKQRQTVVVSNYLAGKMYSMWNMGIANDINVLRNKSVAESALSKRTSLSTIPYKDARSSQVSSAPNPAALAIELHTVGNLNRSVHTNSSSCNLNEHGHSQFECRNERIQIFLTQLKQIAPLVIAFLHDCLGKVQFLVLVADLFVSAA